MKKVSIGIAALVILSSFLVMWNVSLQESAIMDELAHIPAGYGYLKYFDYRLNPEHPPLVKLLSAAPLVFMDLKFPIEINAWQNDVNGQWDVGAVFLYQSGNDADEIIKWARLGPIALTLILIAFVYFWSRELLGPRWALLPTIFTAFSPTILAHGHYVTTDVGAALGIIVALYFFVKFLNLSSRKNLIFAGLAFGLAQLMKFSAVLLVPYFLILAAIYYLTTRKNAWLIFRSVILIFLVGLIFIYPFYLLTTVNYPAEKQFKDTDFILSSFAGGPTPERGICKPMRCLAEFDIWASDKPLIRPLAEYLLGVLMVTQRSAGGNTVYFLGEVSSTGNPLYFPIVYLMKEPIPILILVFLALILGFSRLRKIIQGRKINLKDYLGTHLAEFSMLFFVIVYSLYSVVSTLNIGIRHLLPTIPLVYILTAAGLKHWTQSQELGSRILETRALKLGLMGVLILWFLVSVGRAYPHYLPYFNEAIDTNNGWRYVTDSNYDWGQDLKRLQIFVEQTDLTHSTLQQVQGRPEQSRGATGPGQGKIAVDYFGGGNPKYYLDDTSTPLGASRVEYWQSRKGNPIESNIHWLAVSINFLQLSKGELYPGQMRNPEDEYQWLKNYETPYARAGKSIFIYKLE